jgi:hypothetical protein
LVRFHPGELKGVLQVFRVLKVKKEKKRKEKKRNEIHKNRSRERDHAQGQRQ